MDQNILPFLSCDSGSRDVKLEPCALATSIIKAPVTDWSCRRSAPRTKTTFRRFRTRLRSLSMGTCAFSSSMRPPMIMWMSMRKFVQFRCLWAVRSIFFNHQVFFSALFSCQHGVVPPAYPFLFFLSTNLGTSTPQCQGCC
jgi:hypothetical protein